MKIKTLLILLLFIYSTKAEIENRDPVKAIANKRNGPAEFELELTYFGDKATLCEVKKPNGDLFQIIPTLNWTDSNIEFKKNVYGEDCCGFTILNVTSEYIGSYEIKANTHSSMYPFKEINQPLSVVIEEKIKTIPSDTFYIYPENNLEFSLSETLENFKKCEIVSPNTTKEENYVSNTEYCTMNIQNVSMDNNGTWIIKAIGDNIILYAEVDVIIKELPHIENNITLAQDAQAIINLGPIESTFCQAINPNGKVVTENSGQCTVKIERVTQKENGTWTVKVGLAGAISTFVYEYFVHVIDIGNQNDGEIFTYYKIGEDKKLLQMECVLFVESMKSCRIIRGDGEVFMLDKGIGIDRYKYYSSQKLSTDFGKQFVSCGIYIENPNDIETLPWKCIIVHGDNDTETGSIININQSNDSGENTESHLTTAMVNTTKGNSFNMICYYPSPINYCWFKAPNGTVYSLFPEAPQENYEYYGDGLKMGHCGMKINSANILDQGTWSCNVGTSEIHDTKYVINVRIFDSPLVSNRKKHVIKNGDDIFCKTFDDSPLEYCRFIDPFGDGINPNEQSKSYSNMKTNLVAGYCSLSFLYPREIDEGTWTCIGKPYSKSVEYSDTFEIELNSSHSANIMSFVFLGLFLAIIIVSLIVFFVTVIKMTRENSGRQEHSVTESAPPPSYEEIQKIPLP